MAFRFIICSVFVLLFNTPVGADNSIDDISGDAYYRACTSQDPNEKALCQILTAGLYLGSKHVHVSVNKYLDWIVEEGFVSADDRAVYPNCYPPDAQLGALSAAIIAEIDRKGREQAETTSLMEYLWLPFEKVYGCEYRSMLDGILKQ